MLVLGTSSQQPHKSLYPATLSREIPQASLITAKCAQLYEGRYPGTFPLFPFGSMSQGSLQSLLPLATKISEPGTKPVSQWVLS